MQMFCTGRQGKPRSGAHVSGKARRRRWVGGRTATGNHLPPPPPPAAAGIPTGGRVRRRRACVHPLGFSWRKVSLRAIHFPSLLPPLRIISFSWRELGTCRARAPGVRRFVPAGARGARTLPCRRSRSLVCRLLLLLTT